MKGKLEVGDQVATTPLKSGFAAGTSREQINRGTHLQTFARATPQKVVKTQVAAGEH